MEEVSSQRCTMWRFYDRAQKVIPRGYNGWGRDGPESFFIPFEDQSPGYGRCVLRHISFSNARSRKQLDLCYQGELLNHSTSYCKLRHSMQNLKIKSAHCTGIVTPLRTYLHAIEHIQPNVCMPLHVNQIAENVPCTVNVAYVLCRK